MEGLVTSTFRFRINSRVFGNALKGLLDVWEG
jgi:hypothetical protein